MTDGSSADGSSGPDQPPGPDPTQRLMRFAQIALVVLLLMGAAWWFVDDDQAPTTPPEPAETASQRVQPLEWISFIEPDGAWGYDRISATAAIGWLGDSSVAQDLANLQISAESRGSDLASIRDEFRETMESQGTVSAIDETDRNIPGADGAIRLLTTGEDDEVDFHLLVLLMAVEDRVVEFVLGSAGGPSIAELEASASSVEIDRDLLLEQLGEG